ncbi:MAG: NHLP bacteriocin export ABC transporter permease/ATPase subunit [Gloeocapsa sp. DLM2.Bin57]|nr:MAG: NHLP bacteriocin export ABC transporter permease/ATPase subunit [Gloeocapsa sp. DLM2.Bin57]
MTIIKNYSEDSEGVESQQVIVLDQPQTILILESGSAEIYIRPVVNGAPQRDWHYLFTVQAKEGLFGLNPKIDNPEYQLIAFTTEKVQWFKTSLSHFKTLGEEQSQQGITLIESWIEKIASVLTNQLFSVCPPISLRASQAGTIQLTEQQTLQTNQVLWYSANQGKTKFLGIDSVIIDPNSAILPLSPKLWLEAIGEVEAQLEPTVTVKDSQNLIEGLQHLHDLLWQEIKLRLDRDLEQAKHRLAQREQMDQQAITKSVQALASILEPQTESLPFTEEQTPLLIAMGAVGKAMGVPIFPPAPSEDPKRANLLEAILRASKLRSRLVSLTGQWWLQDHDGPLLAFKEDHTPVAILPIRGVKYELLDPTTMARTLVNDEIANSLSREAFVFYRSLPDQPIKAGDLFKFAFQGRVRDILVIALSALSATLLNMLTPILTGFLVNNVIPNNEATVLLQMGAVLLGATFGIGIFQLVQGFTLLRLEVTTDPPTQAAVWDRVLKLSMPFFRQYSTGDLSSRIEGITQIRRQLSGSTLTTLINSSFALFNLLLMIYYGWELAVAVLLFTAFSVTISTIIGWLKFQKNHQLLALEGKIFGLVVQLLNGVSKLRVRGAEKRAFAYWAKEYQKQMSLNLKVKFLQNIDQILNQSLSPLIYIIIFWLFMFNLLKAESLGINTSLGIGNFMAFNSAMGVFLASINQLTKTLLQSLNVINLWQRSQTILTAPLEIAQNAIDPGIITGRISVEHISFRYNPDSPLILNDVSLKIEPEQFIALVGGSGSGKSTILRLLLGFEQPESGAIYYDNQDLDKLNLQSLRRQMGVVLQNGQLQPGSIFDNIASGAIISEDEAWEAAALAGVANDINAMPMKMHTMVSEGASNISGGQKQRLMIARAIVLKPKILMFDEATSALDNQTQAIVTQGLDTMRITRIVIAHRLSTIRNADKIYVLDRGQIVQSGNFEQLLNQKGLFADLMTRQLA